MSALRSFCLRRRAPHSSTWVSRASTPRSSSVVVSPLISVPEAICLSRRRMILPERVFGNASAKRMSSGLATGPISFELKAKIAAAFCEKLGCTAEEVRFKDNFICGKSDANHIDFADAMRQMWAMQKFPFALGTFKAPCVSWDEHTGQGDAYFTWVYGCQAVELTDRKSTRL